MKPKDQPQGMMLRIFFVLIILIIFMTCSFLWAKTNEAVVAIEKTLAPTATPTHTPTKTPTITPSSTLTLTPTLTLTLTITPSSTLTLTPTFTSTPTLTPSQTLTPTPTLTPSVTLTPTLTPSFTPTYTPSPTPTLTSTYTVTPTYTPTSTPSSTPVCGIQYRPDGMPYSFPSFAAPQLSLNELDGVIMGISDDDLWYYVEGEQNGWIPANLQSFSNRSSCMNLPVQSNGLPYLQSEKGNGGVMYLDDSFTIQNKYDWIVLEGNAKTNYITSVADGAYLYRIDSKNGVSIIDPQLSYHEEELSLVMSFNRENISSVSYVGLQFAFSAGDSSFYEARIDSSCDVNVYRSDSLGYELVAQLGTMTSNNNSCGDPTSDFLILDISKNAQGGYVGTIQHNNVTANVKLNGGLDNPQNKVRLVASGLILEMDFLIAAVSDS